MNQTIESFGYPGTLLGEYEHWVVLLRPAQVTAGSMVLAAKGEVKRLPDVPAEAFAELTHVTGDLEAALAKAFGGFDKINYLLLMMVDPHVHWHVIPRYAKPREVGGVTFADKGWPAHPALKEPVELTEREFAAVYELMRGCWG